MTGTTDFQISFRDGLTETERQNVERSVAALVERTLARAARERAAEAALAELAGPLNAPFARLVQEDPLAVRAAEELRDQEILGSYAMESMRQDDDPYLAPAAPILAPRARASVRTVSFVAPYDFTWVWHGGHPAFNHVAIRETGRVRVDARSGAIDGGASGFVGTHTGVGVVRREGPGRKSASAVLRAAHVFALKTLGVAGDATSEGGFDLAVFEDGSFVGVVDHKLWRSRIGPNEERNGAEGPRELFSNALNFQLGPDHGYSVNVGVWALSDRSPGIGAAAVQSLIEAVVSEITVVG
jgi:hypothetical protein